MTKRTARPIISVLLLLALVAASPQPVRPQGTPLDPNSLLGEWSGSWQNTGGKGKALSGQYHLLIERVEGDKVYGSLLRQARGEIDSKFQGTLNGNTLSFGSQTKTTLTVEGNQMTGTRVSGQKRYPDELKLFKKD